MTRDAKESPFAPFDITSLQKLHKWYKKEHRKLPFRKTSGFYSVWISETMLQQTRVAAMLPLYEKFMERFPNVAALAKSTEEEVLSFWKGLGYYSRARNLRKGAQRILKDYEGQFPKDYAEALKIEGVGPYTAAAVLSISFGKRIPVLDGNVRRVLARLFFLPHPSERDLQELAGMLLNLRPRIHPGLHNQAMMELGATLCSTATPICGSCPLQAGCNSYQEGGPKLAASLPPKRKQKIKEVTLQVFLFDSKGRYLLTKENSSYFFKNLWFFPYRLFSAQDELLFESACLAYLDWNAWREIPYSASAGNSGQSKVTSRPFAFRHQITHHRIEGQVKKFQLSGKKPQLGRNVQTATRQEPLEKPQTSAKLQIGQADFEQQWLEAAKLPGLVVSSILKKLRFS